MSTKNIMIFGKTEESAIRKLDEIKKEYEGCTDYRIESKNDFVIGDIRYMARALSPQFRGSRCKKIYYEKGLDEQDGFWAITRGMIQVGNVRGELIEYE